MKITLEIDKEQRQAKILCADNTLAGDELFIAVATFLTVIADNIYSKHVTGGSSDIVNDGRTWYVTTSTVGQMGKNGNLHIIKFKDYGDPRIDKIEKTYKNVCGETVSIFYKGD